MTEHVTEEPEEGKVIEFKQPRKRATPPPIPKEMPANVPSPEELMAKAAERKAAREKAIAEATPKSKVEKDLQSKITDLEMAMDVETDAEKKSELNRQIELKEKQLKEQITRRVDTEALRGKLGLAKEEAKRKKAEYLGELPGFEHLKPAEPSEEVQASMGEIRSIQEARAKKEKAAARNAAELAARPELKPVSGETEVKATPHEMMEEPKVIVSEELAFKPEERAWFQEGEKISAEHEKAAAEKPDLKVVPSSIEMRLDQVKDMDIPGFDYEGYSSLARRQNSLDKALEQADLGEIKLGFFKKLRMKWELGSIGRALKPFEKDIDVEESAREAQADFEKMTPEERKAYDERQRTRRRIDRKRQSQRTPRGPGSPFGLKG